jgi:UDP-N-acetylglucosamine--N-acetylmuramyl-(pentapeptide) pyrophosphoryl-undecaprenol N-acetylglucosamine transferase
MNNTKVLLTGGHAGTTALAVVQEIRSKKETKDWEVFWIGAKQAIEGRKFPTIESSVLPKLGVHTFGINAGRLQRTLTRHTIPSLLKIPVGLVHAFNLVLKIRPQVVLSFGGFAGFPVVLSAWMLRIPIIVHEQTSAAGRSNLASARFAWRVAIARKTSEKFFSSEKTVLTGNPIMKSILEIPPKKKMGDPPVLFITGGSRGAQSINMSVEKLLPDLVNDFVVIHQTGSLDFNQMNKAREGLQPKLQKRYYVVESIDPLEMHTFFERADIVLGRSGANTVWEVIATKRPAIFIPLPYAYNDEQTANAKFAERFGIGSILEQKFMNADSLQEVLRIVVNEWQDMVDAVIDKKSPDLEGAKNVVDLVQESMQRDNS